MAELLFIYGTLKDPKVQKQVFGRIVKATPDTLKGYKRSKVRIDEMIYPIIIRQPENSVSGVVIEVTRKELKLIDEYETDAYKRTKVELKSGKNAWVYHK